MSHLADLVWLRSGSSTKRTSRRCAWRSTARCCNARRVSSHSGCVSAGVTGECACVRVCRLVSRVSAHARVCRLVSRVSAHARVCRLVSWVSAHARACRLVSRVSAHARVCRLVSGEKLFRKMCRQFALLTKCMHTPYLYIWRHATVVSSLSRSMHNFYTSI